MPGIVARIGGRPPHPSEPSDVLEPLWHFPFYDHAAADCTRGWVGWVGIGAGERRLLADPGGRRLIVHDGDAAEHLGEPRRADVARAIADLAGRDPAALAKLLGGSFAVASLDQETGEFHCVSDLFGHRRIFYRQVGDALYLACELKAFLGWPEFPVAADPAALRDMMNYGYPLGDRTSLVGVKLLPPASRLTFRDGELAVTRYWRPRYQPEDASEERLVTEGYRLFAEAFAAKTAGADRLVVPVSGGLDSRLLICEALARDAEVHAYTYGHARSREAAVSCEVMRHLGLPPRHIVIDDLDHARDLTRRTAWFCEGMVNVGVKAVAAVAERVDLEREGTVFVNGIYGGPTNFSNTYHRPEELVADMPRAEKIDRIGRTMFSAARRSAWNYRILRPEFARACDEAYDREIDRQFDRHEDASPLFGHQKDAFYLENRLCRFMNQVDLNRYYWDEAIALTSTALFEFYLKLPDSVRFGRRLHRRILASVFPHGADAPVYGSGLTVHEELAGATPAPPPSPRLARLRYLAGRLTGGLYNLPDPDDYRSLSYLYRRNVGLRRFYEEVLGDERLLASDVFDLDALRRDLRVQRRGGDRMGQLTTAMAWELWLRQLRDRRRDV